MRRKTRASSTCLLTSQKGVSLCLCVDVSMGEFYMFIDITERCASVSLCACVRVCVCMCIRAHVHGLCPPSFAYAYPNRIRILPITYVLCAYPNHICLSESHMHHTRIRVTYAFAYAYPHHKYIIAYAFAHALPHHIRRITCAFTCMYPNHIRVFELHTCRITHAFTYAYPNHICILAGYGVATISRLLKIISLFWKRAL